MGSWACQTCREDGDDGSGACNYLSIRGTVLLRDWADQRLPRQTQRVDRQATACPLHVSRLKELDVGDRLTALGEPPRGGCVAKMLPLRLRWAARAPVRAARAPVRAHTRWPNARSQRLGTCSANLSSCWFRLASDAGPERRACICFESWPDTSGQFIDRHDTGEDGRGQA